jgi:predicted nucleotidyltransferase
MGTQDSDKMLQGKMDAIPDLGLLRSRRSAILEAAARHGAGNVRVFGSIARGEAGPGSDIDLLVDMEPGRSLLDLAGLHLELEDILGFRVEIGTDVKPRLRDRVHAEAIRL